MVYNGILVFVHHKLMVYNGILVFVHHKLMVYNGILVFVHHKLMVYNGIIVFVHHKLMVYNGILVFVHHKYSTYNRLNSSTIRFMVKHFIALKEKTKKKRACTICYHIMLLLIVNNIVFLFRYVFTVDG